MFRKKIAFVLALFAVVSALLLSACGSGSANKVETDIEDAAYNKGETIGTVGEASLSDRNGKIIRSVTLRGETKDFDSAQKTLKNRIADNGGYVEKSSVTGGESLTSKRKSSRNAVYTIRIPAEKLDSFLETAENMLNIVSSSETTIDITLDYYDIESRMNTLETKKEALENMLEQATTLEEIRVLQDDLYAVIADIEAYRSKLNLYDSKVNYSTVELTITEVVEYTETDEKEQTFGERISETFKSSWRFFGRFCQGLAVFFVGAMPFLVVLAVIAAVVLLIIRLCKRSRRKKARQSNGNADNMKF